MELPFPTGEEIIAFKSYEASEFLGEEYTELRKYIGTIVSINQDGEVTQNKQLDLNILKELLENSDKIKIPTKETMIYLSEVLGINQKNTIKIFDILKNIINKHNTYLNRLTQNKIQDIAWNHAMYQIYQISNDPINLMESQSAIDDTTGPIKSLGREPDKIQETNFEMPGNFMVKFKDIYRCQVGKKGVGISAQGAKAFFGLTFYYDYILNKGSLEDIKRLKFNVQLQDKFGPQSYHLLANAKVLDKNLSRIKDEDFLKILQQVNQDKDAAIDISAFISLSADNAKELKLAELNATPKTLGMYLYGISIGVPVEKLYNIINSDLGLEFSKILDGNIFNNNDGTYTLDNTFNYFESGPTAILNNFKKSIQISNGRYQSPYKLFEKRLKAELEGIDKTNITPESKAIMNSILKLTQNKKRNNIKIFIDFARVNSPLEYKFKVLDKIRATSYKEISPELDMKFKQLVDFIKEYCTQQELVRKNSDIYNNLEVLSEGAEEFRVIGEYYSLNQGIPTSPEEIIQKVRGFENIIVNRLNRIYSKQRRRGIYNNSELPKPFSLLQFVSNKEYQQKCIDKYESIKHTNNVLKAIVTVPHFYGYLLKLANAYGALANSSARFRSTIREGQNMVQKQKARSSKEINYIYKGVGNATNDYLIDYFFLDKGITVNTKDGLISLGTAQGNAKFKNFMEQEIIPRLKQGFLNSEGKSYVVPDIKGNKFIMGLQNILYDLNPSRNASINNSLTINMLPRQDVERNIFNSFKADFNKLSKYSYNTTPADSYPLIDLFYYYTLISYSGKLGESSLYPIFENFQNIGKIQEYHDYIKEFDRHKDLMEVSQKDLLPYTVMSNSPYTSNSEYLYYNNPEVLETQLWIKYHPNPWEEDIRESNPELVKNGYIRGYTEANLDYNLYTKGNYKRDKPQYWEYVNSEGKERTVTLNTGGSKLKSAKVDTKMEDGTVESITIDLSKYDVPYSWSLNTNQNSLDKDIIQSYIENELQKCS